MNNLVTFVLPSSEPHPALLQIVRDINSGDDFPVCIRLTEAKSSNNEVVSAVMWLSEDQWKALKIQMSHAG